jgi:hypothetical protein
MDDPVHPANHPHSRGRLCHTFFRGAGRFVTIMHVGHGVLNKSIKRLVGNLKKALRLFEQSTNSGVCGFKVFREDPGFAHDGHEVGIGHPTR